MASKKPDDRIKLTVSRARKDREVEVVLGQRMERSFKIRPVANPDPLAAMILKDWISTK